jgi:hypothetical protein
MANVGDYLTIKGVKKRWAGENYGWQTPASYSQLEKQGKFKVGAQFLDRLGSYLGPAMQNIQGFQKEFRKATDKIPGMQAVERAVTGAMIQEDKLPSSVVTRGGAVVAQRAGNALNIDPRLAGIGGLLIGGVHTSGPKAGTYKWRPTGDLKPHADLVENAVEQAHQHFNKTGTLKGVNTVIRSTDGVPIARIVNKGNVNFDRRAGLSPIATQSAAPVVEVVEAAAPGRFKPKEPAEQPRRLGETPSWAKTPELEKLRQELLAEGLPDPNLRFNPQATPPHRKLDRETKELLVTSPHPITGKKEDTIKEFYSRSGASAEINGVKYKPTKDNTYAVPGADKGLKIGGQEVTISGAKSAQTRVRQIPGNENVKVDSHQAHHKEPLKDLAEFAGQFDNKRLVFDTLDIVKKSYGSSILNRLDLPERLHQPSFYEPSAHSRLRNQVKGFPESGFILEAPQGTSRWAFLEGLTDEQKAKYMPYFLIDSKQNARIADEVGFSENLLQPGNKATVNPYVGNFAQQVMAPLNKDALKLIKQLRKNHREAL